MIFFLSSCLSAFTAEYLRQHGSTFLFLFLSPCRFWLCAKIESNMSKIKRTTKFIRKGYISDLRSSADGYSSAPVMDGVRLRQAIFHRMSAEYHCFCEYLMRHAHVSFYGPRNYDATSYHEAAFNIIAVLILISSDWKTRLHFGFGSRFLYSSWPC